MYLPCRTRSNRKTIVSIFSLIVVAAISISLLPLNVFAADDFEVVMGRLEKYRGPGGHVIIPDGITTIGYNSFTGSTGLTGVTIPDTVSRIECDAFRDCINLKSIEIPESIKEIDAYTFAGCTGLQSVSLPNSITAIQYGAFYGCTSLKKITIPDSVSIIGPQAFSECTSLTGITIPGGVVHMCWGVFSGCTGLTGVSIPQSLSIIDMEMFAGCKNLVSITLPNSITSISERAFKGCESLTGVTIPNSVTEISWNSFSDCVKLTIYGAVSSYAEAYAKENSIPFIGVGGIPSNTSVPAKDMFYGWEEWKPQHTPANSPYLFYRLTSPEAKASADTIIDSVSKMRYELFASYFAGETGVNVTLVFPGYSKSFDVVDAEQDELLAFTFLSCAYMFGRTAFTRGNAVDVEFDYQGNEIHVSLCTPLSTGLAVTMRNIVLGAKAHADDARGRLRYIRDWLEENTEYNHRDLTGYSSTSALVNRLAVCEGFANAMNELCYLLDIPCLRLASMAANHAWNMVYIDGEWIILDATTGFRHVLFFGATDGFRTVDFDLTPCKDYLTNPEKRSWSVASPGATTLQHPGIISANTWAHGIIESAMENELIPAPLQSKYRQATTRAEFCALAVALFEKALGAEITARQTFSDTSDINVEKMAGLSVVNGFGDDLFFPNDLLTREQAATLIVRLLDAMGKPLSLAVPTFSDEALLSVWAKQAVGQVQAAGIMGGVGSNRFAPKDPYTREQSIITIQRLYDMF